MAFSTFNLTHQTVISDKNLETCFVFVMVLCYSLSMTNFFSNHHFHQFCAWWFGSQRDTLFIPMTKPIAKVHITIFHRLYVKQQHNKAIKKGIPLPPPLFQMKLNFIPKNKYATKSKSIIIYYVKLGTQSHILECSTLFTLGVFEI